MKDVSPEGRIEETLKLMTAPLILAVSTGVSLVHWLS